MRVIKTEPQRITILTANGTELVCRPVRTLPIQDLMFKIGLPATLADSPNATEISDALQQGSAVQQMDTIKASMALFNYCMAYGVETDPPAEAIEELTSLGLTSSTVPGRRVMWLNYLVLEDLDEAALLAGIILSVTKTSKQPPKKDIPVPVESE